MLIQNRQQFYNKTFQKDLLCKYNRSSYYFLNHYLRNGSKNNKIVFELNITFVLSEIYEKKIIYEYFIDRSELIENFINFLKDDFSGLVDLIYLDASCVPKVNNDKKSYTYSIRFLVSFYSFLGDALVYLVKLNAFKLRRKEMASEYTIRNEIFNTIKYSWEHLAYAKVPKIGYEKLSIDNFLSSIKLTFDQNDSEEEITNYFYLGSYNKDWEDFFTITNLSTFYIAECNLLQFVTPLVDKNTKISYVMPELSKFVHYPRLDFLYDDDGNWDGFKGGIHGGVYSSKTSIPNRFYTDKTLNLLNFTYLNLKGFTLINNNVYLFDQNSKNYIYHSTYKEFWSKVSLIELFNFLRPHLSELRYFTFSEFKYRFYDSPDFSEPYQYGLYSDFERNPRYFNKYFYQT